MIISQPQAHFEIYDTALSKCIVCGEEVEIGPTEHIGYCPTCKKAREMENPLFKSREVMDESEFYTTGEDSHSKNAVLDS